MLIVHRANEPDQYIAVDSRKDGEETIKIAELLGNKDINGTPVTFELVEYEDTPL